MTGRLCQQIPPSLNIALRQAEIASSFDRLLDTATPRSLRFIGSEKYLATIQPSGAVSSRIAKNQSDIGPRLTFTYSIVIQTTTNSCVR